MLQGAADQRLHPFLIAHEVRGLDQGFMGGEGQGVVVVPGACGQQAERDLGIGVCRLMGARLQGLLGNNRDRPRE